MQLLSFYIENILMGALLKKNISAHVYISGGCFHHWDQLYGLKNPIFFFFCEKRGFKPSTQWLM